MSMKVVIQHLAFAFVFTMFTTQQVWGETDCYKERDWVKHNCLITITILGPYVHPTRRCARAVKKSNMNCMRRIITHEDETKIILEKIVRLAHQCHKPVIPFHRHFIPIHHKKAHP
uniref:Bifunctional inhibitor/plant lipid transfer protein/seed storage helical domain-containing protein n=1 Tax=Setaria viridis TaxID=4556 RepID=A0A4U6V108_SETVI|nr:hypothetical protein SEVIR_4G197700v2 [Setaria viridis]